MALTEIPKELSSTPSIVDNSTGTAITIDSSNNTNFADNAKAIFGAGSDLHIYHDGTNSYISDQGTNDLKVLATDFQLKNSADNEFMMTAVTDGAVTMYHNNAAKLATTATGIDVTGSVTADGLTVDTDTLVVDATNNRVGIGTSSPQSIVHIDQGASDAQLTLETHAAGDSKVVFSQGQTAGNWAVGYDDGGGVTENSLSFAYKADGYPSLSGQNKMILTPAGNVGIGTTSPSAKVNIDTAVAGDGGASSATRNLLLLQTSGTQATAGTLKIDGIIHPSVYKINIDSSTGAGAAAPLSFSTSNGATETMRIDASGNLLVSGTSLTEDNHWHTKDGTCYSYRASGVGRVHNQFFNAGSLRGEITSSAGGATLFTSISDSRVKENITDAADAGSTIDALQVRQFDMIGGAHHDYGMVAQELALVCPDSVYQPEDSEKMMSVDYSKLVPMLVKEIQSLRARIAALES